MEILAAVTARLSALGYTVSETDSAALDYNIKKAETTLKARTNQLEVPEGLFYVWADMAAGMFLTDKKASARSPKSTTSTRQLRAFLKATPPSPSRLQIPALSRTSSTQCSRRW
jgi:hypothetical protein